MRKVVRWTFFADEAYPETEWPISEGTEKEYIDVIITAIREHEYRITGFAHQGSQFCTPVFDDGRRYAATFRQWGQIMADALHIERKHGYTVWAWFPPTEGEKLPVPTDWDEDDESRKRQEQRWDAEQKRQVLRLRMDIEALSENEELYRWILTTSS